MQGANWRTSGLSSSVAWHFGPRQGSRSTYYERSITVFHNSKFFEHYVWKDSDEYHSEVPSHPLNQNMSFPFLFRTNLEGLMSWKLGTVLVSGGFSGVAQR
jgi:hypothetical protein